MTSPPGPVTVSSHAIAADDIVEATEKLFVEIAQAAGSEALRQAILSINEQMQLIRPYEAAFISNRQAEFDTLSTSWAARDIPEVKRLITAYFERRQNITPDLVNMITHPN